MFSSPCILTRIRDRVQSARAQIIAGILLQWVLPKKGRIMTVRPQHTIVTIIPKGRNITMWYIIVRICSKGLILRRIMFCLLLICKDTKKNYYNCILRFILFSL
jgi:hypothetical protein